MRTCREYNCYSFQSESDIPTVTVDQQHTIGMFAGAVFLLIARVVEFYRYS